MIGAVKIYTKTGDAGETGLFDGTRVAKSAARVDAYGEVDELNALLGVARGAGVDADISALLDALQRDLMALGSQLADPSGTRASRIPKAALGQEAVARLEEWIDRLETEAPSLDHFVLPGGSPAGAVLHLARTVCRRAERRVVSLGVGAVKPEALAYVNRLSDLLFVLARAVNRRADAPEVEW